MQSSQFAVPGVKRTVKATVSGGSGTVAFQANTFGLTCDEGSTLTRPIVSDVAVCTFTVPNAPLTTPKITATYSGDTGSPSQIALYIMPTDSIERYVDYTFLRLLNRHVDAGGLAYWRGLILQGTFRGAIAWAIVTSPEFRSTTVNGIYLSALGHTADSGGLAYWMGVLASGYPSTVVLSNVVASQEYFSINGNTNQSFVNAAYLLILNRPADPSSSFFVNQLNSGVGRAAVTNALIYSVEAMTRAVTEIYPAFLGRPIDNQGKSYWVGQLLSGLPVEVLIALLVASDEAFALYQAAGVATS
jgi:hypothetical protein